MKRFLSLALICAILVCSLAPVVSASEDDYGIIEVLDFCLPNESSSSKVYYANMPAAFTMDQSRAIRYMDIIFEVPVGQTPTVFYAAIARTSPQDSAFCNFTIINIHDNVYRAFGTCDLVTKGFFLHIGNSISWVDFISVRVSYSPLTGIDEKGSCFISATGYTDTINYVPTDIINYRHFTGNSSPESNSLWLHINCPNWRKYDYLDIYFTADISSLNTISATLGDTIIPFRSSVIDSGAGIQNHYGVTIRLDLREIDRSSSEELFVSVFGNVNSGSDNFISMDGIRGFYLAASFDSGVSWYRKLYNSINSLISKNNSILLKLGDIYEMLIQDNKASEDFQDEASGLISGLDGISSSMDAVERPSMDTVNVDYSADISDASVLMANLFSAVSSSAWVSRIILASITIGLISYILYGKD